LPIGIRFQVRVSTVGNANSSILAEMERKVSTRCSYALSQACEKCKKTKAAGNSRYRRQRNSNQWLQPCPSELITINSSCTDNGDATILSVASMTRLLKFWHVDSKTRPSPCHITFASFRHLGNQATDRKNGPRTMADVFPSAVAIADIPMAQMSMPMGRTARRRRT